MWYLKYDTNELIQEGETDSQTQRTDLWLPKEKGGGDQLEFGIYTHTHTHTHTPIYKIDNQQGQGTLPNIW